LQQIPLAIGPDPIQSLQSYLPGPNAAAHAHLATLVWPTSPVYLWGESGTGKTHLLRAMALRCHAVGQQAGWFDPADRTPWTLSPAWAMVLIDRCEALDDAAQQAAFSSFVEAQANGVQVIAAGRLPPVDLPLREDLRTRLGWGHVFALQPLPEAQTRAAFRREADHRGIFISDEVMGYLMTRFDRDMKSLMELLDRLDDYSLVRGRPITVPLVKTVCAEAQLEGQHG
jgi:DnaA family protein